MSVEELDFPLQGEAPLNRPPAASAPRPRWGFAKPALVFMGLALLHGSRWPAHVRHPSLFAEEAQIFVSGMLDGHFLPMMWSGYFNLFTAVVLRAALAISPHYMPRIGTTVVILLATATFGYLLLPHWEKLIRSKLRWILVIFFLGFSPFHEGIGILEYDIWYFGIGAGILTLELLYLPEEAPRYKYLKAAYVLIGGLTGPVVLTTVGAIYAAYFLCQWARIGLAAALRRLVSQLPTPWVICFVVTGLTQAVSIAMSAPIGSSGAKEYGYFPEASMYLINMKVIIPTFVNLYVVNNFINTSPVASTILFCLSAILCAVVFPFFRRRLGPAREASIVLFIAAIFTTWVTYVVRGIMFALSRYPWGVTPDGMRYALIPGFLFLTGAVCAFDRLPPVTRRILAVLLVPLAVAAGISNYQSKLPSAAADWAETARQIRQYQRGERDDISRRVFPVEYKVWVHRHPWTATAAVPVDAAYFSEVNSAARDTGVLSEESLSKWPWGDSFVRTTCIGPYMISKGFYGDQSGGGVQDEIWNRVPVSSQIAGLRVRQYKESGFAGGITRIVTHLGGRPVEEIAGKRVALEFCFRIPDGSHWSEMWNFGVRYSDSEFDPVSQVENAKEELGIIPFAPAELSFNTWHKSTMSFTVPKNARGLALFWMCNNNLNNATMELCAVRLKTVP